MASVIDSGDDGTSMRKKLDLKNSPIFKLSALFAVFPFTLDKQLRIKYMSLLYNLCVTVIISKFYFVRMNQIIRQEQSNTNVLLYGGYVTMNALLIVGCVLTPLANRDLIVSILHQLSKVDQLIQSTKLGFEFQQDNSRQYRQAIFTIGVVVTFFLLYVKASSENVFPSFGYAEFYILPITWLTVFQIDYFMVLVKNRFVFVNIQLENELIALKCRADGEKDDVDDAVNDKDTMRISLKPEVVNCLNHIHYTLYTIFREINATYSTQLLIIVPRVIFFCVLPVHYNIVTALVKDFGNGTSQLWTHLFTTSFIVLLLAPVIYAVNISTNTVNQAKKIHLLIHDLIDEDQNDKMEYELLAFSVQLMHRNIEFSVYEFFTLKPSLTTAIFELIITYVIILLQFQDTLTSLSPVRLLLHPITALSSAYNETIKLSVGNLSSKLINITRTGLIQQI